MNNERELKRWSDNIAQAINRQGQVIDQHAKLLNQHNAVLNSMGRAMGPDPLESASKYNGIVVGIGYAGYFGLWSMVKDLTNVCQTVFVLSALFMAVSLTTFVFWEVMTMVVRTVVQAHEATGDLTEPSLYRFAKKLHQAELRIWPYQLIIAVVTGLLGMGSLTAVMVAHLVAVL